MAGNTPRPVSTTPSPFDTGTLPLDPAIETLRLNATARQAAYALKQAHPAVKFTSGRRGKDDQARAMASNVVKKRNFIRDTYRPGIVSNACQKWVDDNPSKTTLEEITAGLLAVINAAPEAEAIKLSRHLSGDAFDVQPVVADGDAIKRTIRALPGLTLFLEREGGLERWHAQF